MALYGESICMAVLQKLIIYVNYDNFKASSHVVVGKPLSPRQPLLLSML